MFLSLCAHKKRGAREGPRAEPLYARCYNVKSMTRGTQRGTESPCGRRAGGQRGRARDVPFRVRQGDNAVAVGVHGRALAGTCAYRWRMIASTSRCNASQGTSTTTATCPSGSYGQTAGAGPLKSTARHVTHGRAVFGNLVESSDVFMGHTDELKTIWRQDGRWFAGKPRLKTTRPCASSRPPVTTA